MRSWQQPFRLASDRNQTCTLGRQVRTKGSSSVISLWNGTACCWLVPRQMLTGSERGRQGEPHRGACGLRGLRRAAYGHQTGAHDTGRLLAWLQ